MGFGTRKYRMSILEKYLHGRKLDDEDEQIVLDLCSLGLMNIGFHDANGDFYQTASTTTLGKRFVAVEVIERSRWRRFWYSITLWL